MKSANVIRALLLNGREIIFETGELEEQRTVESAWISEAAKNGRRVSVKGALIVGPLDLRGQHVAAEFSISKCQIASPVDLTDASFGQLLDFSGSTFQKPCGLRGTVLERDAWFTKAVFAGLANFDDARIDGNLFGRSVKFRGEASFTRIQIHGTCQLGGARFDRKTSFNSAIIDGGISFHDSQSEPPTVFSGMADFMHARLASANFEFVVFRGRALFTAVTFGRAIFRGALFDARSDCSFRGATFQGEALFQGAMFRDKASFLASRFMSMAHFSHEERKYQGICFVGASFAKVNFDFARFESSSDFESTRFTDRASFREAVLRSASFSRTGMVGPLKQFSGVVDLRGCTYERIEAPAKTLLAAVAQSEAIGGYDRQPYIQLEGAYRRSGRGQDADGVYLARKRAERKEHYRRNEWGPWVGSLLYNFTANYGIRPYRLLLASLFLIVIGGYVFSRQGSLVPKEDAISNLATQQAQSKQKEVLSEQRESIPLGLRFTIRAFLPVDVPLATKWEPSDKNLLLGLRAYDLAAILKLAGWLLVPLGVAALTGLLRVRPSV